MVDIHSNKISSLFISVLYFMTGALLVLRSLLLPVFNSFYVKASMSEVKVMSAVSGQGRICSVEDVQEGANTARIVS